MEGAALDGRDGLLAGVQGSVLAPTWALGRGGAVRCPPAKCPVFRAQLTPPGVPLPTLAFQSLSFLTCKMGWLCLPQAQLGVKRLVKT